MKKKDKMQNNKKDIIISNEKLQNHIYYLGRTRKGLTNCSSKEKRIISIINKVREKRKEIYNKNNDLNLFNKSKIQLKIEKLNKKKLELEYLKLYKENKKLIKRNKKLTHELYFLKKQLNILIQQFEDFKSLYNKLYSKYINDMDII